MKWHKGVHWHTVRKVNVAQRLLEQARYARKQARYARKLLSSRVDPRQS
jgi:hypothetical protein